MKPFHIHWKLKFDFFVAVQHCETCLFVVYFSIIRRIPLSFSEHISPFVNWFFSLLFVPPKMDGGYVVTPISVCLWTKYLKKLWTDLAEIWWRAWVTDKMIWFWWRTGSENFKVILHHWEIRPKTTNRRIPQKVMDRFRQNLVDELVWWQ